ncbi:MAG: DUF2520 domain-containing protein [Bacteroidales bacterium]|nr:DUF2520 domain-containing protein [Bacteroidales bacterium]
MPQFGKIAIIGAGNVAYTLCKILKSKEIEPYCIFVRNPEKAAKMHEDLGVETVSDYEKVLESDLSIIAVKDDAIADVSEHLLDYKGLVVHTSGTKSSELLNRCMRFGIFYPLQTMSKEREISFDEIPLLIYANSPDDVEMLGRFAKQFSNKVVFCDDEQRKAIHLAAVYVSNFTNVMLGIGDKLLKNNGLTLDLMKPLVMEMIQKLFEISPEKALTGPARRGDFATIEEHVKMLSDNSQEQGIYKMLTNYILENYQKNEKL